MSYCNNRTTAVVSVATDFALHCYARGGGGGLHSMPNGALVVPGMPCMLARMNGMYRLARD